MPPSALAAIRMLGSEGQGWGARTRRSEKAGSSLGGSFPGSRILTPESCLGVSRSEDRRLGPACSRRCTSSPRSGSPMRLLHPPSLLTTGRRSWRDHQAQALKQHDRTLRRATPDELATLALAVLYVDVAARVLQAAILESAVDEDSVVKNKVLVFEDLVFVSSHPRRRLPLPRICRKLTAGQDVPFPARHAGAVCKVRRRGPPESKPSTPFVWAHEGRPGHAP